MGRDQNRLVTARQQYGWSACAQIARGQSRRLHRGHDARTRLQDRDAGRDGQRRARERDERVVAGKDRIEVARLRITEAGRRALADRAKY